MAIDYASPIGQVRLLIADLDEADPILSDAQITGYLNLPKVNGDVTRGAAECLRAIAYSELLLSKKIRTQDLQTDGPAVAAVLLKRAAELDDQAASDAEGSWFEIVAPGGGFPHEGEELKL